LLGVVIGLSFLLRYDLLVLAPAAACALGVGRGPEGRRQLAWAALGTILAAAPWLLRNWIYFGAPHVLLSIERNLFMRPFVDPYVSTAQLDVWDALRDADFVMAKLARFTWPFKRWSVFLGWHSPWIGPVFLAAGLVFLMRRHPAGRIWLFVMVAFLLRTLLLSIMHHELRFYVSFGAVVNVLAVGGLAVALEALSGRRWVPAGVAATAAIALLLPALYSAATASPPPATPPQMHRLRAEAAALESRSKRGSVIATRWGAPMAWYANRPTIDVLPSQVGTLVRLGARIDGLFYPKEDAERVGALLRGQRISERYALIPNVDGSGALWLTRRAIRRGVLRSSSMKGEAPATKAGPGMGVLDAP
jgi:hypothetical protein